MQLEGTTPGVAIRIPDGLYLGVGVDTTTAALNPQAIYNGGYTEAKDIRLRIANGGAGQSGLIGAWANAFIQYSVKNLGLEPFLVRTSFQIEFLYLSIPLVCRLVGI